MGHEHFIRETIRPVAATFDTGRMATGEPGLPRCFHWRDHLLEIEAVIRQWRETSPCHHGSGELYVRKHNYEVRLTTGAVAKLYFERQARAKSQAKKRWWLLSLAESDGELRTGCSEDGRYGAPPHPPAGESMTPRTPHSMAADRGDGQEVHDKGYATMAIATSAAMSLGRSGGPAVLQQGSGGQSPAGSA